MTVITKGWKNPRIVKIDGEGNLAYEVETHCGGCEVCETRVAELEKRIEKRSFFATVHRTKQKTWLKMKLNKAEALEPLKHLSRVLGAKVSRKQRGKG